MNEEELARARHQIEVNFQKAVRKQKISTVLAILLAVVALLGILTTDWSYINEILPLRL